MGKCLGSAGAEYRRMKDGLMSARVALSLAEGEARAAKGSDRALAAFSSAEKTCREDRCSGVRRRALTTLSRLYEQKGDLEGAARATITEVHLVAQTLPAHLKAYGWTARADALCERWEAQSGAGRCRKLEQSLFGMHLFRDFSTQKARGEGLEPDLVRQVNQHYEILLRPCLRAVGERLQRHTTSTYQLRWTVKPDGTVGNVQISSGYDPSGGLVQCLRQKLAIWRYPRYRGELQHVEQSFTVASTG
jgi:hypothetical protein